MNSYKGIIPADRWHEPYLSRGELQTQVEAGVKFRCYTVDDRVIGVMGLQDRSEVQLIRHAYVHTAQRRLGIGSSLLKEITRFASGKPTLIGTWADATWAIRFYEKNGFRLVDEAEKELLLRKYWSIPERQIQTSVVLADRHYLAAPRNTRIKTSGA